LALDGRRSRMLSAAVGGDGADAFFGICAGMLSEDVFELRLGMTAWTEFLRDIVGDLVDGAASSLRALVVVVVVVKVVVALAVVLE